MLASQLHGVILRSGDSRTRSEQSGSPFLQRARVKSVPAIQVSTPEMNLAEEWNRDAQAFWENTQQLLNDLKTLQQDTQAIVCPCTKPECPFRVKNNTVTSDYITSSLEELRGGQRMNGTISSGRRHTHHSLTPNLLHRSDCEIAIEEEPDSDDSYEFKRNTPSRTARRRLLSRSSLCVDKKRNSLLSLPSQSPFPPSSRSISLPSPSFSLFSPDYNALVQFQRQQFYSNGRSASA